MANYYVVPQGYTGTVPSGYTALEVSNDWIWGDRIEVNSGDTYMMSSSLSGEVDIRPADGYDQTDPVNVIIEGGNSDSLNLNFDVVSGREDLVVNLSVPDGADASMVTVDAEDTDGVTLTVGDNAQLGTYAGGTDDTDVDVITTGSGSVIGNIDTNAGDDVVTIGGTAGTIQTEGGNNTVTVLDGATVGDVSSATGSDDSLNLTVGTGATVGNVTGGDGDDTITLGNDVTIGSIDLNGTNSTGDTITAGSNVTVNGDITQDTGDSSSTVTFGDDATINGNINTAGGVDSITLGDNASVTGYIETGSDVSSSDADTLVIGANSTIDGYINTNAGDDTITIGDNTTLNGSTAINTYLGNDSVTLGTGVTATNDIFTSAGSDTVISSGAGSYTVDQYTVTPNDDLVTVNYGSDEAGFQAALAAQGFTDDDGDGVYYGESNDTFTYNGITYNNADWISGIACFAAGTLIETDRGAVAIEDLAEGDLVRTLDNGMQPIRWIGASKMSAALLAAEGKLRPIRIRAGALGEGMPAADLLVSPQHRILVRSKIAQKMFGAQEVLVAAKQLLQIDGIDIAADLAEVTYFHMLFDQHEVVISNGAETESLYTGPEALKSVGPAALEEIFAIFPELKGRDYTPVAARVLASGRMGRKLAVRHAQNRKALVA